MPTIIAALLFIFSLFISVASAATPTWQGYYVGGYLGGGFGSGRVSTNAGTVTDTSYFATPADINAVNNVGTSTQNLNSAIAGVEAGRDWVWKHMVYGLVVDYGALPLSSSKGVHDTNYPDNSNIYSVDTSINANWLLTFRGRLGYQAMLHWPSLFYVTGGMAVTQLKVSNYFNDNSPYAGAGGASTTEDQVGWTAGIGVEFTSFKQVFLDFEYLYIYAPSTQITSVISNTQAGFGIPLHSLISPFSTSVNFHANLFKMELSYRFFY